MCARGQSCVHPGGYFLRYGYSGIFEKRFISCTSGSGMNPSLSAKSIASQTIVKVARTEESRTTLRPALPGSELRNLEPVHPCFVAAATSARLRKGRVVTRYDQRPQLAKCEIQLSCMIEPIPLCGEQAARLRHLAHTKVRGSHHGREVGEIIPR